MKPISDQQKHLTKNYLVDDDAHANENDDTIEYQIATEIQQMGNNVIKKQEPHRKISGDEEFEPMPEDE